MAESPEEPPFLRVGPEAPCSPVVLSVPHAGRAYSPALLASSRLSRELLETLEDRLVDRLIWRATADGATALVALRPRAEIDLNRDEREIDPSMVVPPPPSRSVMASPRTKSGLGLVPSRISGAGAIWLDRLPSGELGRRILTVHRPYHQALRGLLEVARARFGAALLLDCHSMPPRGSLGGSIAGVVLGDRHGTSIAPDLLATAAATIEAQGYSVALNEPYAGGFITGEHGRPQAGIHALQLEIDRSLYLDRALKAPGPGFDGVARMIAAVAGSLAARLTAPPHAIAAE
jgi:N-formylglutamate amidohydrolase